MPQCNFILITQRAATQLRLLNSWVAGAILRNQIKRRYGHEKVNCVKIYFVCSSNGFSN